jgi:hypothetical protein
MPRGGAQTVAPAIRRAVSLESRGNITDLVEEERAFVSQFELSRLAGRGPGKRALLISNRSLSNRFSGIAVQLISQRA